MAQRPINWNRMSPEDQALWNYQNASSDFIAGGAAQYDAGKALNYQDMDPNQVAQLQQSGMNNISTDPRLQNAQLDALRQLEEQSKTGFTARDEADLAKLQSDVNRQNRGRMGAIQQNMAARGMSGSGMDLMAQMQSSQDATEREALAALEKNAQMGERKDAAIMNRGQMSGQMRGQDFSEHAQKAQAQDAINRFNTANKVQSQFQNNQGSNQANQANWNRTNQTGDNNTQSGYQYRKDVMGVGQNNAQMSYNKATEDYNRAQLRKQQREAKRKGVGQMLGTVAGGVAGAYFGGPAGAMAGSQVGGQLGGAFAHGGIVPGRAPFEYMDTPENDIFAAELSPGEIVIPKSIAHDPQASAKFIAAQNAGMDPLASKYVAQNPPLLSKTSAGASGSWGDEEPLPKNKPVPSNKNSGKAPVQQPPPSTAQQASISPKALEALAKTQPDLVAQYRERMSGSDKAVAGAEKMQGYMGIANMAGKALNDYSNSQKTDVILKNRMQDLGSVPTIREAERKEYNGSMLDKLGAQGVANAKDNRVLEESRFDKETQLDVMDKANRKEAEMNDPNSAESQSAREYLKQIAPSAASMPNFGSLSSAQIAKIAPGIYKSYADGKDNEIKKYGVDSSSSTQRRSQDLDMTKAGWTLDSHAADRTSREGMQDKELGTKERISDKDRDARQQWLYSGNGVKVSKEAIKDAREVRALEAGAEKKAQVFDNLRSLRKESSMTGPVAGRIGKGLNAVGISVGDEFDQMNARQMSMMNAYIKETTGASMSENESKRLMAVMPDVSDSDSLYENKMKALEAETQAIINERRAAAGMTPLQPKEEKPQQKNNGSKKYDWED